MSGRLEQIRERAERANMAYELHGQRPTEYHGRYALDVAHLLECIERLEAENERLRDALGEMRAETQYIWWE